MGGLQTLYAGIRNTDMFAHLGVFSSGWFTNNPELTKPEYAFMKENASTINNNLESFWISMGGEEDIAFNNNKEMMAKFDEMGIKYHYSEYPGGHTWPVWRHNLFPLHLSCLGEHGSQNEILSDCFRILTIF